VQVHTTSCLQMCALVCAQWEGLNVCTVQGGMNATGSTCSRMHLKSLSASAAVVTASAAVAASAAAVTPASDVAAAAVDVACWQQLGPSWALELLTFVTRVRVGGYTSASVFAG
jgi:hypothetical protein